jgi:hypothetical protein
MVEFWGCTGFLLLICTMAPFVLRRLRIWRAAAIMLTRYHHSLALTGAAALTLHGFLALTARHGWGRGALLRSQNMIFTGIITWLVLMAVIILAMTASRQKPSIKTHCWVVVLLILLATVHVF